MSWWEFASWGAFGGFAVETVEFYTAMRRTRSFPWKVPGEIGRGPLILSILIRVLLGSGLAWALASGGQISGAVGAIAVGVAAPLILEKMGNQLPAGFDREIESERRGSSDEIDKEALPSGAIEESSGRHEARPADGSSSRAPRT
jgi:hypothetical protein